MIHVLPQAQEDVGAASDAAVNLGDLRTEY